MDDRKLAIRRLVFRYRDDIRFLMPVVQAMLQPNSWFANRLDLVRHVCKELFPGNTLEAAMRGDHRIAMYVLLTIGLVFRFYLCAFLKTQRLVLTSFIALLRC